MRILLTNDDGIRSPGLEACARELSRLGPVTVVAPAGQRSAISHAITLYQPLVVVERSGTSAAPRVAMDGTPVDCVKIAFAKLCPEPPELVVSGINYGSNLGVNVLYSGTVAAALESAIAGVPGIALSLEYTPNPDFRAAARAVRGLLRELATNFAGRGVAFNVNVPARPSGRIAGIAWTRMDTVPQRDRYVASTDPRGRPYYWIEGDSPPPRRTGRSETARYRPELTLDQDACRAGYISVTPLSCDLTHFELLMSQRAKASRRRGGSARGTARRPPTE